MQCLGKEEKWLNDASKLRRAGWINHDRQKARISIHPLVREACVQETTLKPTWERQGLFILAVLKAADTPCSHQMVLQIMEVLRQICLIIPPNKLYLDFVAEIYLKTGWLYELCGNYQAAQEFMNVAQCLRSDLPETHHSIVRTKSHLAGIKQQLGCYAEAETLFYEVLALRQKQLESVDHPNLAADHNNLCGVLLSIGKYEDSIRHGLRALELLNRSDNYTSRDLCLVYSALSTAYGQIEDYVQQLSYAQKAVDIIENDSSVHPKIMITAYSKLCVSLHSQQRWNEMLTYALKTLRICEKELPVDHPSYATAYGRLADAYYGLNQYDKALEYITYKISVYEKVLPALHPNIGSSYFIKGRILFEQKKYTDAYEYFNSAKQLFTRAYGENHPETKSCNKALAITENLLKA
jgi:tetratricopeptide (TPR) repeat protein